VELSRQRLGNRNRAIASPFMPSVSLGREREHKFGDWSLVWKEIPNETGDLSQLRVADRQARMAGDDETGMGGRVPEVLLGKGPGETSGDSRRADSGRGMGLEANLAYLPSPNLGGSSAETLQLSWAPRLRRVWQPK
jgi:hypothetical protein